MAGMVDDSTLSGLGVRRTARRRADAKARRIAVPAALCALLLVLLPSDGHLGPARVDLVVKQTIDGQGLRLGAWEIQAVHQKLGDAIRQPGDELSAQARHDLVIDYFATIDRMSQLRANIEQLFAQELKEGALASASSLQAELDALRTRQEERRPTVERVLEQQVGAALSLSSLTTAGLVWPPIRFQFTESPYYLIISPRMRIAVEKGVYLDPEMVVEEMNRIEERLQEVLDVSALVEGTGGFSSYPTMVVEYASLDWVLDTIAHEWVHTYLVFHPLGWSYFDSGQMRTINETVASIVGEEIGHQVVRLFYPERVGPVDWPRPLSMGAAWIGSAEAKPDFSYGEFMRRTRLEVDRLLADGQVEEAEAYMENRRLELVARGYSVRKLNQAYFAFHGSYAVGPAATDPIGARLRLLRRQSASLADFVHSVATFNDPADLDAALQ